MQQMIGKKFGKWTVVSFNCYRYKNDDCYNCKCECGKQKIVGGSQLRCGRSIQCKNCGAKNMKRNKGNQSKLWRGYGGLHSCLWSRVINNAKYRNIPFDLTIEYVWNLYLEQDGRCAVTKLKITFPEKIHDHPKSTASLDRIDSSQGYIEGNVMWVHKQVNLMKQSLGVEEFYIWCNKIAKENPRSCDDNVNNYQMIVGGRQKRYTDRYKNK